MCHDRYRTAAYCEAGLTCHPAFLQGQHLGTGAHNLSGLVQGCRPAVVSADALVAPETSSVNQALASAATRAGLAAVSYLWNMGNGEPAASLSSLPQAELQSFFPLPLEGLRQSGSVMADSFRSQSPLRRECSSDELQVRTPPQSEGLKAGLEEQPQIDPFPIFGRPAAPVVESVDTHSLSLSWVASQLEGCGGNRLDGADLPSCGVGYSLEMQLIGTVGVRLAEGLGNLSTEPEPLGSRTG